MTTVDDILKDPKAQPIVNEVEAKRDEPSSVSAAKDTTPKPKQDKSIPAATMDVDRKDATPIAKSVETVQESLSKPQPVKTPYEDMFKAFSTYKPQTDEELKKEQKRQKAKKTIAAIGDGVSALSNLYFTTKGAPNMYTGNDSMSERTKVSYEKLMNQRSKDAYNHYMGLVKARQADAAERRAGEAADNAEREWQRQLDMDQRALDWHNEAADKEAKAAKAARRKARKEFKYKQEQDRIRNENDKAAIDVRRQSIYAAQAAKDKSSSKDKVGFKSADGSQISIDKDVLDGSMAEAYNTIIGDPNATGIPSWERPREKADIETFVKKYWSQSPAAKKYMLELSKYSTADDSKLNDDNDVIDYKPSDVIDYKPGKSK